MLRIAEGCVLLLDRLQTNLSRCSHQLADPGNLIDRPSPHSFSHTRKVHSTHPFLNEISQVASVWRKSGRSERVCQSKRFPLQGCQR